MSVLLRGGRVITAADDYTADIYVEDEVITLIGRSLEVAADEVIDARGKYVLPGCIDPHTHLDMDFGGVTTCDDFTSGTISAAFGGTTTHVDFCLQQRGQSLGDALATYRGKIDRAKPVIDVGFHIAITDLDEGGALEELAGLPDEGVTSFKLFLAYPGLVMVDDETLFRTMQEAARTGALVMVHAEHGDSIDVLRAQAIAEGKTEPVWHALTRPTETEAEAVGRVIQLGHIAGAHIYIVHVSCREALEPIERARNLGWRTWAETCPQYLFIDQSYIERPNFEGAKYVFTPPPRPKEHQAHLWRSLANHTLSVISTDHAPVTWADRKALGRDDFTKIPNGAPGIEDRLMMIHHFGARAGHFSLNRMVELLSTNPARLFGLYPRKGTIAVGCDADLVVFDPEKRIVLSAERHHSRVDYNLFEGTEVVGVPEAVLVRGKVIVREDELLGRPGDGKFVRRARVGEQLRPVEATGATSLAARG